MTADLAQLSQSLKDNEAFQAALDHVRDDALGALATMKRDDEQGFYSAQATIRVVDDLRGNLEAFIRAGKPPNKPGIA